MSELQRFETEFGGRIELPAEIEGIDVAAAFAWNDLTVPAWAQFLTPDSDVMYMVRYQQGVRNDETLDDRSRLVAQAKLFLMEKFYTGYRARTHVPVPSAMNMQASSMIEQLWKSRNLPEDLRGELEGFLGETYEAFAHYFSTSTA